MLVASSNIVAIVGYYPSTRYEMRCISYLDRYTYILR